MAILTAATLPAGFAASGARAQTPAASAPSASRDPSRFKATEPIRKRDSVRRGVRECHITFAYEGHAAETIFWKEPCADVTATMTARPELETLNRWRRLSEFDKRFIAALPGGRVLSVEGRHSASLYPIGTTGLTYEVGVAD